MSILLDPTSERIPAERVRAARLASLDGKTIGLLDIAKARGDIFLGRARGERDPLCEADVHEAGSDRSATRDRRAV